VRAVVFELIYIIQRSCVCSLSQQQWANFLTATFVVWVILCGTFLSRDAMQAWPMSSWCVRPSLTFMDTIKTNKCIFKIFSPSDSRTILVFPHQMSWQYSNGDPPNGSIEFRWGRHKSRFWRIAGYWSITAEVWTTSATV